MRLTCCFSKCNLGPNTGPKVMDTNRGNPVFTNTATRLPHDSTRYYCCDRHRTLGEEEARLKRPHLATTNGVKVIEFDVVNNKAERMF